MKQKRSSKSPKSPNPPILPIPSSPLEKSARLATNLEDRIQQWLNDHDAGRNPEHSFLTSLHVMAQTISSTFRIQRQYDQHINPLAPRTPKNPSPTQKDNTNDKEKDDYLSQEELAHLARAYARIYPNRKLPHGSAEPQPPKEPV